MKPNSIIWFDLTEQTLFLICNSKQTILAWPPQQTPDIRPGQLGRSWTVTQSSTVSVTTLTTASSDHLSCPVSELPRESPGSNSPAGDQDDDSEAMN